MNEDKSGLEVVKMGRKHLFRGKRLNNGEWVYGSLFLPDLEDHPTEILCGTNIVRISYEVDPDTVGEYTGALDKNKVKLYDGDIVKTKNGRVCLIVWLDATHGWDLIPVARFDCKPPDKWDIWWPENLEKIGNKWDNPDLMEETP